jgi:sulfide:quinone oxidoreductase
MRKKVVVLGSNFGGLTAALAVKHELHGDVDVRVISPSDRFVFNPSLIWLPFGKRSPEDITFPVEPTFDRAGIDFVHAAVTDIDPEGKRVRTPDGTWTGYDYLVIATGYQNKMDVVPGLADNAVTITTLQDAIRAGQRWREFLDDPGDVVIAATQGAGCFGAAYEFLFNTSYRLRKAGLKKRVTLTYVSAEPFLGHFGIGGLPHGESLLGMFMKKEHISVRLNAEMDHVAADAVVLTDGTEIPFRYAMIVPPFIGQDVVAQEPGVGRREGLRARAGHLPEREVRRRVRGGDRGRGRRAMADRRPGGHPEDRLSHRGAGAHRGQEHRRADPRRGGRHDEAVR